MRVGVVVLPQFDPLETQRRWKALEDMGFVQGWTYDHLAWRDLADEPWHSTFSTLTVAALATTRLRIGTMVATPNFRHPVTLAKELMSLDVVSGGRVVAGLGAGGSGWDAGMLGHPQMTAAQRFQRFDEFVTLTDAILRQAETTWRGEHYEARSARSVPGCVTSPRVPFVVAANGPRAMAIAARCEGWVTTGPTTDDRVEWWAGVAAAAQRFDEISGAAPPPPRAFTRHLNVDGGPTYALSSLRAFRDAVGRAADLGFTDVVTHWPRASREYVGDVGVLAQVASLLGPDGSVSP